MFMFSPLEQFQLNFLFFNIKSTFNKFFGDWNLFNFIVDMNIFDELIVDSELNFFFF